MRAMNRSISTVIRTYNEAEFIGQLIQSLRNQQNSGQDLEIVVVDSSSTDSTLQVLANLDVRVIKIAKDEFNYSKALNLGIDQTNGELIVILSAHSIPFTSCWLEKMVRHFEDENTAGVYCRQISRPDTNLLESMRIKKTFSENSKVFGSGNGEFPNFSNAASCIRRRIWERHKFVNLTAAEDREWSKWAIESEYRIIYDAEAKVYHCHNESCRKAAQRVIDLEKATDVRNKRKRNIPLTVKQSVGWLVRDMKQIHHSNCSKDKTIKCSLESLARSFWYVMDFNRYDK